MFPEGCATSLPNVPVLTEAASGAKPEIAGPQGRLPPRRARTLLTREAEATDAENLVKKTVALMESLSGRSLTSGNKITLLVDGPATYEAMFRAIGAARDHVNFETFTFGAGRDDPCKNRCYRRRLVYGRIDQHRPLELRPR